MSKLANCPLCHNGNIAVLSGRSFSIGCQDCYQVKLLCFDSKEEAIEAWNKLFIIKIEDYNFLIRDIKELQIICRKYRAENKDLKAPLKRIKDIGEKMPEFLEGFRK